MENTYSISYSTQPLTYSTPPSLTTYSTIPIGRELRPQKIIYNNRTTVVIWNDGTKTKTTCAENDIFDEYLGFASCLLKKMYGKKVHGKRLFDRMIEGAERHNKATISKVGREADFENIREQIKTTRYGSGKKWT